MENSILFDLIGKFNFAGVSFVSIKGYCSDKSGNTEIADILINVGASYENMQKDDLKTLKEAKNNLEALVNDKFGKELILQAIEEKIKSIMLPNANRSNGQSENGIVLNNGLIYFPNTRSLTINGSVVRKNVIRKGEYKEVNSKPLTLAKKHIDKVLNLKVAKLRRYKIDNIETIRVTGDTIEL